MVSITHRLVQLFSLTPRKCYNIFAGTNTFSEWRYMVQAWWSGGPYDLTGTIEDYENRFANYCGAKHGISFGAGRMALYAILTALDIGEGDEVIIPAFTCVVVPNAILYRGAHPIYVDIEPHFFNIDVQKVEAAITPRTKALYAQHTFGVPCNVDALREIGRRHGLTVIEDAAHALGATYKNKPIGSLTEVAFFSTDHSKVINTHLGGIALTSNDALAARLKSVQMSAPFLDKNLSRRLIRSFLLEYYIFSPNLLWLGRIFHVLLTRVGFLFFFKDELKTKIPTNYSYPCRMSSAQAQVGLSQLEGLKKNLTHRRKIANWLENKVRWYKMAPDEVNGSTWLRYSFLVENRSKFEAAFNKHFDLGIWFTSVVSGRVRNLGDVKYQSGSCPIAEFVAQHIVNLPTHPRIPIEIIQKEFERNWSQIDSEILYDIFR